MEPIASAIENVKGFAKSAEDFVLNRRNGSGRGNQIDTLKRLLRESFSDLMKLRDRQDKVERMLSFYKSSKGSPFQEASTHVKGEFDVLGALWMINDDHQNIELLNRAGIRTWIESRLAFETGVRQKDYFVAEFACSKKGLGNFDPEFGNSYADVGSPLSLAKVLYVANVTNWFSAVAIPMGARCKDIGIATSYSQKGKGFTEFLSCGPPVINQQKDSGFGLVVSKSNVVASLAQFVSRTWQPGYVGKELDFSTFGQVACQLSRGTKLSLLGLHQVSKSMSEAVNLGPLSIPIGTLKWRKASPESTDASAEHSVMDSERNPSARSLAVVLESQLEESTRIGGWVQMESSNPKYVQWAVTMSDTPEDELLGWGLSLGGMNHIGSSNPAVVLNRSQSSKTIDGLASWEHFQVEAFIKLNLGRKFSLQPGFVYVMNGDTQVPALMLRSTWSL